MSEISPLEKELIAKGWKYITSVPRGLELVDDPFDERRLIQNLQLERIPYEVVTRPNDFEQRSYVYVPKEHHEKAKELLNPNYQPDISIILSD